MAQSKKCCLDEITNKIKSYHNQNLSFSSSVKNTELEYTIEKTMLFQVLNTSFSEEKQRMLACL